jgi:hypothetical protein
VTGCPLEGTAGPVVGDEDALHLRLLAGRQRADGIADGDRAALDLPLEAAEGMVGAADALDREVEALLGLGERGDVDRLEVVEQHGAIIPGHVRGALRDVVALGRGDGDEYDAFEPELLLQGRDLALDLAEAGLGIADEVHLVHGKDERADSHERADARMASRLREHALLGVDEDDREVGERSAAGHVPRIFLVPRRVCADEAAAVRREIPISHVDRDALLALGHEAVQQQGVVDGAAAAADLGIEQQRLLLVGIEQLGIIEQMADQRRLAVVDAPAGDEFK